MDIVSKLWRMLSIGVLGGFLVVVAVLIILGVFGVTPW